jgi:hypothetical protein
MVSATMDRSQARIEVHATIEDCIRRSKIVFGEDDDRR